MKGPGSNLSKMISLLGIENCPRCRERAKQMDEWGIKGCEKHMEKIVGWLCEGRDTPAMRAVARASVTAAITAEKLKRGMHVRVAVHSLYIKAKGAFRKGDKKEPAEPPPESQ
jgi:hypothetical protein